MRLPLAEARRRRRTRPGREVGLACSDREPRSRWGSRRPIPDTPWGTCSPGGAEAASSNSRIDGLIMRPPFISAVNSRIIDFALSNALNSGIRRIAVATQYKAHSLIRHFVLGKTELNHIISASSLVTNTIVALKVLREMVFDPKQRQTINGGGSDGDEAGAPIPPRTNFRFSLHKPIYR